MFKIYFKYIKMNFLSGFQYKGWPIMLVQVLFVVISDPIGLIFLFSRFGGIGEWSVERILLIYSIALTSFGLAESFCRGFDYFPWRILRTGDFDRIMLRPKPLSIQIAGSYFHLHRLVRVFGGSIAITWCLTTMSVDISPIDFLMLLMALVGGFLMYIGVFMFTSGIAFFTIQGLDWIFIFTNASYQVTRCPMDYMPKALKATFTFLIPMLLVSYYPASAICGWGESYLLGFISLPAGFLFLLLSHQIWKLGVRHYKSTGS